jgi:hypothetical protein
MPFARQRRQVLKINQKQIPLGACSIRVSELLEDCEPANCKSSMYVY